jgi:hypothetical protein
MAPHDSPVVTTGTATLGRLIEQLQAVESQQNPDLVAPIHAIRMTEAGLIQTPAGRAVLTDWSRHQLASLLGVRWDKWFQGARPEERAEETNRRLARMPASTRLRLRTTRQVAPDVQADATLQALVSPTYTAVPDSHVARTIHEVLNIQGTKAEVQRVATTDRTVSYALLLGAPQTVGGMVGAVWGGLSVQNSGLGYCSLTVRAFLYRLACANGLVVTYPGSEIVRKRHTSIDMAGLEAQLRAGLARLPEGLARTVSMLERSTGSRVEDVRGELERVLREARIPLRHLNPILAAFGSEPHQTSFGISQALTSYGRDLAPEDRALFEVAAGRYLGGLGST